MKLSRSRRFLLIIALLDLALAWVQVLRARAGLVVRHLEREGVPLTFMALEEAENAPGVLIAHGFGSSSQAMLAYGHVLAHAGYAVMLWDFAGHAANPAPLNTGGDVLQADLDVAFAALVSQPEVDGSQVALLGHSMGSGAVMSAGIRDVERYAAVVAVSPTSADVTANAPRNLLLQAGMFEPQFAANARTLLAAAGGTNDDLVGGRGRAFKLIPGVEHITILFNPISHQAALDWLDRTFGRQSQSTYWDSRILWYVFSVGAGMVALVAAATLFPSATSKSATRPRWGWALVILAPFGATVLLFIISQFATINTLGGVVVGGALGLWLLFVGLAMGVGIRPGWPSLSTLLWGGVLFVLLWFIFGALAQVVWLPWLLIPARLLRWPVLALLCLPWTVAAAHGQQGQKWLMRLGWWLGQSLLLGVGLLLAVFAIPGLGVLILVLPLFPVMTGLMTLANAAIRDPWAGGIGGALFFAWLLLAYFPLAG
jgi:dienelactone hydrolase